MWIFGDNLSKYEKELTRTINELRTENKFLRQRITDLERLLGIAEKTCDTLREQIKEKQNGCVESKMNPEKYDKLCSIAQKVFNMDECPEFSSLSKKDQEEVMKMIDGIHEGMSRACEKSRLGTWS